MSARELLKHVRALRPRERERFLAAILEMDPAPVRGSARLRRVKWPDVHRRARRILGNSVLPNLVLLEREEEPH